MGTRGVEDKGPVDARVGGLGRRGSGTRVGGRNQGCRRSGSVETRQLGQPYGGMGQLRSKTV